MIDLIWQYRKKPKARATAKLLNDEVVKGFDDALAVAEILNIETATGYGLDLVGRHVGFSRLQAQMILKDWFGFNQAENKRGFNFGEFYRYKGELKGDFYLSDYDYRFLIKAKIIKNYQAGTLENIYKSLEFLFGKGNFVFDNYDMSLNLVIKKTKLNLFLLKMVLKNDVLVRPVGVGYKIVVLVENSFFGFSQNENSVGFNKGKMARILNDL